MFRAEFHSSISGICPVTWDGLFADDNPFIQHGFLKALEKSKCASDESGWTARHLLLFDGDHAVAAMPLYLKAHSYGEFVFDWGWAEAYERFGLDYYPKLTTAIPFTPSAGPRIGVQCGVDKKAVISGLCKAVQQLAGEIGASGWHLLFPEKSGDADTFFRDAGMLGRKDVQFHWFNHGYKSFEDYLAVLRSSRRKNLKRERKAVAKQGIRLERMVGADITAEAWSAFYQCYCQTYLKRSGHSGYLSRDFFDQLLGRQAQSLMLVVARLDETIVATSLFFQDSKRLYGRYWGSLQHIDCLHFEACFYQGIEYCIERGLKEFDPGTQGEHKLLRGFEPIETRSWHWISDPRFRDAIGRFLEAEKLATRDYSEQAATLLPFRNEAR